MGGSISRILPPIVRPYKVDKKGGLQMDQSKMNPNFEEAIKRLPFQYRSEKSVMLEKLVRDLS